MGSVLVVDDEQSMREFLAICLQRAGHDVRVAESGTRALASMGDSPVDVVVTDLKMPGDIGGLELLREIKGRELDTEVIVVTAFATPETAIQAMKQGAYDYLTKPFKVDEINSVIARALEKRALVEENIALRDKVAGRVRLANLLGKSPPMQRLFELIGKIHSTKTNVLITGESGTGKELVARALHTEGNRAAHNFVAVNCGAIPENLMESELFGYVKGAFTGANTDKEGLFQRAHEGTLFLDEIGELSLSLQVKLLRALQERTVKPVGSAEEQTVDVRVIAATNRDLEEEVANGAFRNDLYYRLNVIELRLPPLRERGEDIPMLIEHFMSRFAAEQDKGAMQLDVETTRVLRDYGYPGNVRELENIMERAVTLCGGQTIGVDVLPRFKAPAAVAPSVDAQEIPEDGIDLDRMLYEYERSIVVKALGQTQGVRKKAARLLGVSFRSLRYRLSKLGLDTASEKNPAKNPASDPSGDKPG